MSYHPSEDMLRAYVQGELDAANSFAIATHVEICPQCKKVCSQLEELAAEQFCAAAVEVDDSSDDLMAMLDNIVLLEEDPEPFKFKRKNRTITVNGKHFSLPLSLSRFVDGMSEWKSYGGKVFSAEVNLGEEAKVSLLYISEEVQIPQHTHKGLESTLVLHGGFSDEEGHYEVGDFMLKDASIKHSPYTRKGEDCLCLTVLTEPLLFTQGVARMFNRFGKGMYP